MSRYDQLKAVIDGVKPKRILEVGTWCGLRAIDMVERAMKHEPKVHYIGIDLFELATSDTDAVELNVKKHFSLAEVEERLQGYRFTHPGFTFELHRGFSRDVLPNIDKTVDLAFVDGGHSIDTISFDLKSLQDVPVLVADDFYMADEQEKIPDTKQFGCNAVLESGQVGKGWLVLPIQDPVKGGGYVRMAVRGWQPKVNLQVKTRNCVPDEQIQENIKFAVSQNLNMIQICKPAKERALMVSAGPSVQKYLDEIRSAKGRIICVKHSHDLLIENGIIPWACILLDPRDHVQDFIENPHPDVHYIVASMVHRTTLERLIERNAKILVYHAMVGAGEGDLIKQGFFVGGGSCAATRGISVLHVLGFRKFTLYGFDSCYPEKPTGPREDYQRVEVIGRKFWTDMELVAQAQDFEKLMGQGFVDLRVKGDGMISHIWKQRRPRQTLAGVEAAFG